MESKYMVTIQHEMQKVAYIEFSSDGDEEAKVRGEDIVSRYKAQPVFTPRFPCITGNYSGVKPPVLYYHISKWVASAMTQNARGRFSDGHWSKI